MTRLPESFIHQGFRASFVEFVLKAALVAMSLVCIFGTSSFAIGL